MFISELEEVNPLKKSSSSLIQLGNLPSPVLP